MVESAKLTTKLVGDINGEFFIPSYQRGYRWLPEHITMLLDDIYSNGTKNYCLQPVVVKNREDGLYELIDGQQRLTSIYLIQKYMERLIPDLVEINYSLTYETREMSAEFLNSLDESQKEDNVDFFHIYNAYSAIEKWFDNGQGKKASKAFQLLNAFNEKVSVIWYEIEKSNTATEEENESKSIELFTRLNIGKIPLTNAELVKALFLSKDAEANDLKALTDEKQLEIATSWDTIEKELHNPSLWSFLTNEHEKNYQTRIELIFNMMAEKSSDTREKFYTFFHFTEELKTKAKVAAWKEIELFYNTLKEWYEHRDIYHKVGFLIASNESIGELKKESEELSKTEFQASLNGRIRNKLDMTKASLYELSYDKQKDRARIERLLLLFNVETVRLLQDSTEKYSFEHHKNRSWSLEHIHAQNSEGLNKKEDQKRWLELHRNSLMKLSNNEKNAEAVTEVVAEIDEQKEVITQVVFEEIFGKVTKLLSEENDDRSYIDFISNMALLSVENNAALNNSTFDVKRNKILKLDRKGAYIPICTRRVFLKYYSNSENTHLQFWGEDDRKSYMEAIIRVLKPYLKDEEMEELNVAE